MPIITIDDKEYESDSLSAIVKEQLQSLQFVDNELNRLKSQMAVFQTARAAYANALRRELATPTSEFAGDTIKLG